MLTVVWIAYVALLIPYRIQRNATELYYKQLEVCQKFEKSGSEGFKSCEQSSAQMSHELAEDGRYRRIWPKILAGALGVPILFYVLVRLVAAAAVWVYRGYARNG